MSERNLYGVHQDERGVHFGPWVYGAIVLLFLLVLTVVMQLGVKKLEGAEAPRTLRVISPLDADTVVLALTWTPAEPGSSPVVQYVYELLAGAGELELTMVGRDSVDVDQPRFASWNAPRPPVGTCTRVQARVIARDSRGLLSRDGWGTTPVMELCTPHTGPDTPVPSLDTASVAALAPDSVRTYPAHLEMQVGQVAPMCAYRWDGEEQRPLLTARWAVADRTIGMIGPPSSPDSTHCMQLEALGIPDWDVNDDELVNFQAAWAHWMRQARGSWPAFVEAYGSGALREPGLTYVIATDVPEVPVLVDPSRRGEDGGG